MYLIDNPNPYQKQYRENRRGKFTGGVLLHTTESPKERGAEPIARWIATQRRDHGSYHCIVDNKTAINMAPDNYETWHCAAKGFNQATWGISFACRSVDLNPDDQWTRDAINQAGFQIAAMWARNGFPISGPKPAQALLSEPGFSTHGDAQPWDRSDAWTKHPRRRELEDLLIKAINKHQLPNERDPMKQVMMQEPDGTVWMYYAGTPWRMHVKTPADVNVFKFFGVEYKVIDAKQAAFFRRYSKNIVGG